MKNNVFQQLFVILGLLLISVGCSTAHPSAKSEPSSSEGTKAEQRSEYDLPPHRFIRRGMGVERVKSLVGEPEEIEQKGQQTEVWSYSFGIVMVKGGTVQYKYPPSERQRPAQ